MLRLRSEARSAHLTAPLSMTNLGVASSPSPVHEAGSKPYLNKSPRSTVAASPAAPNNGVTPKISSSVFSVEL